MPEVTLTQLPVMQYFLLYDADALCNVVLERISFIPQRWVINRRGSFLSQAPCEDCYSFHIGVPRMPSQDGVISEYEWDTPQEALRFWTRKRPQILATNAEMRAYYKGKPLS